MINIFRYILLILFINSILDVSGFASNSPIISDNIIQNNNNNILNINDIVFSDLPVSFKTSNAVKCIWTVSVLNKRGEYEVIEKTQEYTDSYTFNPRVRTHWQWYECSKQYIEQLNRYVFNLRISVIGESGGESSIDMLFSLLPEKPVISNVKFDYVYDWERDDMYGNAVLSFDVKEEDYDNLCLICVTPSRCFDWPGSFNMLIPYTLTDTFTRVIIDDADWGEYYSVYVENYFGAVCSDLIFTTDYIHDPDILQRLEELRLQQSSIDDIHVDSMLKIKDNIVLCDASVQYMMVVGIDGKLISDYHNPQHVDLSNLSIGLYIIRYMDNYGNIFNYKFVKK